MQYLVVSPLHERRINGHHRLEAPAGHARSYGDGVLFCYPHVEDPLGKTFLDLLEPRALEHGSADADHRGVRLHQLLHSVGEDLGIGRRPGPRP